MPFTENLPDIAHAIQLAIAPVFLLTGIAGLLGVIAARLSRIIDRARHFEHAWPQLDEAQREAAHVELSDLERRRRLASWAINSCALAALLVCLVIGTLFIEALLELRLKWLAGLLFTLAMVALIGGLASFVREVYLATQTVRILTARIGR